MIIPTNPTVKMSSGVGSLVLALRCAKEDLATAVHRLVERGDRTLRPTKSWLTM